MPSPRHAPIARLDEREFEAEAELFDVLATGARSRILATLARSDDEFCSCVFGEGLDLAPSTVAHHLERLATSGLVTTTRRGPCRYYRLAPDARERIDRALREIVPGA